MKAISLFFGLLVASTAASLHHQHLHPQIKRDVCSGNTASNRQKWCNYDASTNYYDVVPNTGVTREYYFTIQEVTVAPDGYSRSAMAINGSIPGPTIHANWGDHVIVHVTNNLASVKNGSSIHFHEIRQNYTNPNDGVVSITQCPTAPGKTTTYKWRATQYGSSWYHSHIGLQAWEGVFGGIVIDGPATENYDVDKGSLFLNDWSHRTVDELYDSAQSSGPPTLDNGLINGTNVYGDDNSTSQTGYRFNTSVTAGTSYRFRLVNAAIDTHFKFSIDNHTLTVMAMDFVPIEPFNTTVLSIGMGKIDVFSHVGWNIKLTLSTQAKDTTLSFTRTSPQATIATGCAPSPKKPVPTTTASITSRESCITATHPPPPPQPATSTPTAATTCPCPI